MSDKPKEGLDRRDFMIASIATVGASAALAVNAGAANAQDTAAPSGRAGIGNRLYRRCDPGEKGRQRARRQRPGARQEAPSVFSGRADAHRTVLVCVRDGRQGGKAGQARRSDQWRAWRRDEFRAYGPDRDEPARSGGDVGHGDGGHGRVPPGHRKHAAPMAQFGQGHRSGRHEPGVARKRERRHRAQPARRAAVQPAAAAERRLRDRLPYRDDRIRGHRIQYCRAWTCPRSRRWWTSTPSARSSTTTTYPGVLHNAFIDAGIPSFCPEIGAARVLDLEMIALFVEGTMNVLKHHGIVAGPMGRTGKDVSVFRRQQRVPDPGNRGRDRRASGQAQRQGRSRTEGGHPAQQLRRGGCGIYERRGRRGDGPAQRCIVRARQPPAFILFHKAAPEGVEFYPE